MAGQGFPEPPRIPGRCDIDGSPLAQREDDRPDAIRQRMEIYRRQTAPLLDYYRREGLLCIIDGNVDPTTVAGKIDAIIANGCTHEPAHDA